MAEGKGEEKVRTKYPGEEKKPQTINFFSDSQASFFPKQKQETTCKENSTIVNSKSCKRKSINNCFSWRTCDTYIFK